MTNFSTALALVLVHEGGYADHPADPGGATMKGVTQRVYDAWRKRDDLPARPVRSIEEHELRAIYREQYWDRIRGDALPVGIGYAVFDYAVNSGPAQAARDLQRALGVEADGVIGAVTVEAARSCDSFAVVRDLCDRRMRLLRGLKHWKAFGRGWTRRVEHVRRDALAMIQGTGAAPQITPDTPPPAAAKADPHDVSAGRVVTEMTTKEAAAAGAAVLGSLGSLASGSGPIQWAVAAVLVIAAAGAVYVLARRKLREG